MTGAPEPTALYRLFGDEGALLYVGIAANFGRRWQEHARSQPWWPEVRRQTVEWHPGRGTAEDAEEAAIKSERPRHNVTHNRDSPDSGASPQTPRAREVNVRYGTMLRRLRRERGITQTALAELMTANSWPWHQTTVARIERGERAVDAGEAVDLADLYGFSINDWDDISRAAIPICKRGAA